MLSIFTSQIPVKEIQWQGFGDDSMGTWGPKSGSPAFTYKAGIAAHPCNPRAKMGRIPKAL